jgi:predicted dehydrogenase
MIETSKLRVGVIGVGSLGQHHARNYATMANVSLVAIVDNNLAQAQKISENLTSTSKETQKNKNFFSKIFSRIPVETPNSGVSITQSQQPQKIQIFTDYKDLLGKVDAVSISSPTPLHYEIAKFCLENKIHCLVEKPITTTIEQADELIDISNKNNVILQIGHIERFNPAIIELQNFVKKAKYIDINRLGPYSARVAHVGVVLDLMVHDLDMVLFLTNSEVESVDAVGTRVISEHEDIANVRLKFKNGCVANISASRVSLEKLRKIRIFQTDSYISLDYEHQSFKLYKKKENLLRIEKLTDIEIVKFAPKKNEPLYLELMDFVDCVINNKKPKVDGTHGRNALKLALDVTSKINEFLE